MSTPCPSPTGYAGTICPNRPPYVPPVHHAHLALTGTDPWFWAAIACLVIVVGVIVLLAIFARRLWRARNRQN